MLNKKLIILSPYLDLSGGVVSFVKSLKGHWNLDEIYFFRGGKKGNKILKYFHFASDLIKFLIGLITITDSKVFINTSLNKKAYQRDQLFCKLAILLQKDVYLFIHGWDNDFFETIEKRFNKTPFFKTKKIFVLSKGFKNSIVKTGYLNENIVVEHTVVDTDFINTFKDSTKDFNDTSINLLYLARMEKVKGIYTVLESFKKLYYKHPNLNLDIAGIGAESENIKAWINSNQELPIRYHGRVEGDYKKNLFKKAHFYLLPTTHPEGLPISILEAISSGCIVFVTPSGGLKDFFKDKEMGFLLNDASQKELEEKIKSALKDFDALIEITSQNISRGQSEYGPQSLIDRMKSSIYA